MYCPQIREREGLRYVERQCVLDLHVDGRTADNLRRNRLILETELK